MSERNGEWGVEGGEWENVAESQAAISDADDLAPTPHSPLPTPEESGVIIDRSDHPISRRRIPENVLKVLYRLHRSGYRAYLCGGSVRDLLMNGTPKDFDIATDAHPTEIRRLFRNSRIIGRRFRLVHIIFQDMLVEVATFRREPERNEDAEEQCSAEAQVNYDFCFLPTR